jgi:uncharacterized protein YodC (DUF2158 family)
MESIKLKSFVQLKSGGPIMTVESFARKQKAGNPLLAVRVVDESQLNCEWFEGSNWMHGTFDAAELLTVSDPNSVNPLSTDVVMKAYTRISHS